MIDKILLATTNSGKIREIKDRLRDIDIATTTLEDHGITLEREEKGQTYHENARIKADEAHEKTGEPAVAEDSGIEIDALDGEPGIRSDRWAGEAGREEKNRRILERLEGVPEDQRTARYVSDMVLVADGEELIHTRGICEGRIADKPRGVHGFGYDPIFEVEVEDYDTFGELHERVKQTVSHRARALNKLISYLEQYNQETSDS